MPTKTEKDQDLAAGTTGHEWDGIREFNNPLPRWWLYVLYATVAFSVGYWVLMPAIPTLSGHTPGLLGYNSRLALEEKVAAARAAQGELYQRVVVSEPRDILRDPQLFAFAAAGGRAAFADNCAPCHGPGGAGRPGGFPSLADDSWLWGGSLDAIETSIRYGIRSDHRQSRFSEMTAFGRDGILSPGEIFDVAEYVLSLTGRSTDGQAVARGASLYVEHCEACHGKGGVGVRDSGSPALNDAIWLYGGDAAQVRAQIHSPRHGVMPAWEPRLDPVTIKMLTIHVHSGLGGGE